MSDLHVGFTGTQFGMTTDQMITVLKVLATLKPYAVHHGDCIGADEELDTIARRLLKISHIVIHPPTDMSKRAFCPVTWVTTVFKDPKPYLERNQDIVDECNPIIATPFSAKQQQRSGTWSTMRKTLKAEKDLITVWPSGVRTNGDWR